VKIKRIHKHRIGEDIVNRRISRAPDRRIVVVPKEVVLESNAVLVGLNHRGASTAVSNDVIPYQHIVSGHTHSGPRNVVARIILHDSPGEERIVLTRVVNEHSRIAAPDHIIPHDEVGAEFHCDTLMNDQAGAVPIEGASLRVGKRRRDSSNDVAFYDGNGSAAENGGAHVGWINAVAAD
jgi:hypothetical protein